MRIQVLGGLAVSAVIACSAAAATASQSARSATAKATAVAAGFYHTCALTSTAGVKCWGYNAYGELGDGTTTARRRPAAVLGLGSGVRAISSAYHYTCALTSAGGVKCWGRNDFGQLGDGTTTDRHAPVAVAGLASGVVAVSAGRNHACALTEAGGVKCWGRGGWLGDGTSIDRHTPVDVSGLASGVRAISAGGEGQTCALTSAGGVKCWGNTYDGTWTWRLTPVDVSGLARGVRAISAGGAHTCALTSAGGVTCWGYNGHGELGDGKECGDFCLPVLVRGLGSGVHTISSGGEHTCALTRRGKVKCWGGNAYGVLGDGTTTSRYTPVAVSRLASDVRAISAGGFHTCALTRRGGLKCWGNNFYGQLGDGTRRWPHYTPVGVIGFGGSFKCLVPFVLGKPLAKAKPMIAGAHCRVGMVTRVASPKKKNTVVGQSPPSGKRLKIGAKVNLEVSRGR